MSSSAGFRMLPSLHFAFARHVRPRDRPVSSLFLPSVRECAHNVTAGEYLSQSEALDNSDLSSRRA
jgi:hypothetical protein